MRELNAKRYSSFAFVFLFLGLMLATEMIAQEVSFLARRVTRDGGHPDVLAAGDFNGDGHMDLAVVNNPIASSCPITIWLGDGQGNFRSSGEGNSGPCRLVGYPHGDVKTGDFNNDGALDLIVANVGSENVVLFLGNGQGGLGLPRNFTVGRDPRSITVGDFNNDNNSDLVVAVSGTTNVSILLGDGSGDFKVSSFDVRFNPSSITSGDFNEDGYLDVAVAGGNKIAILLGNGKGDFNLARTFELERAVGFIVVGDFDNDGALDLASSGGFTLLGDGHGNFSPRRAFNGTAFSRVATGDFDKDGNLDLALDNGSVLLGDGQGGFGPVRTFDVGCQPMAIVAEDFNEDGNLDLAVTNWHIRARPDIDPGSISLLLGDGRGDFASARNFGVGNRPVSVITGDFNNDGNLDIATANKLSNDVSILLGDGQGDFKAVGNFNVGRGPVSITVGDFNNDGNLDLATANAGTFADPKNTLSVLLGDGDGGFSEAGEFEVGRRPSSVVAGDFDNDGNLDLAVSGDPITLLLGKGDGGFVVSKLPISSMDITAGDFNNDGNLDLVAGDGFVLLGDGHGNFETRRFEVEFPIVALKVGDFNNDGNLDVAGVAREFSILLGDGKGGFFDIRSNRDISSIFTIADFDNDGNLDVASFSRCIACDDGILIYLGDGQANLSNRGAFRFGCESSRSFDSAVAAGDFNNDGLPDLAVANEFNRVYILINNTPEH